MLRCARAAFPAPLTPSGPLPRAAAARPPGLRGGGAAPPSAAKLPLPRERRPPRLGAVPGLRGAAVAAGGRAPERRGTRPRGSGLERPGLRVVRSGREARGRRRLRLRR